MLNCDICNGGNLTYCTHCSASAPYLKSDFTGCLTNCNLDATLTNCETCINSTYCTKCTGSAPFLKSDFSGCIVDCLLDKKMKGCAGCINSSFCSLCNNTMFLSLKNNYCLVSTSCDNNTAGLNYKILYSKFYINLFILLIINFSFKAVLSADN